MGEVGLLVALTIAQALREGALVDEVRAATIIAGAENVWQPALLDSDQEIELLEQRISQLSRRAERARKNSLDSETESNRRAFRREADKNIRLADETRASITALRSRPPDELQLPADVQLDPVVRVLGSVATADALTLAECYAVQQLVRDLALMPDGLLLHGSFRACIPTPTRQLLLGPLAFSMPNRCRNGVAPYLQRTDFTSRTMAPAFRSRAERKHLLDGLQADPARLPSAAAATAASAFLAAIPRLLRGDPPGERSRAWSDPRWAEHLRHTYRTSPRASGPWLLIDPARQALSYAIADADHPLDAEEVADVLTRYGVPNARTRLYQFSADARVAHLNTSKSWSWPPAVIRSGTGRRRAFRLRSCPACDGPTDLVVNTPELPFACMCSCGSAPGLPGDLYVPASFQITAPTREQLAAYETGLVAHESLLNLLRLPSPAAGAN